MLNLDDFETVTDDFTTIILNANLPVPPTYTVLCPHGASPFIFMNAYVECQRQDYAEVTEVTESMNPSGSIRQHVRYAVNRTVFYFGTCPTCGKKYKFAARFVEEKSNV